VANSIFCAFFSAFFANTNSRLAFFSANSNSFSAFASANFFSF